MTRVKYTTVRGMDDILPDEVAIWRRIEEAAREIFESFGCSEIRTPIVEKTDLFIRSIGESTAVVEKEMYTFSDRDGESLSLRPEATASVVRAYIDTHGADDRLAKYYYMGPMFRRERPQKGRKRQFHQIGVEVIGASHPAVDAEVMNMCHILFSKLGITDYMLEINSIGCPVCRPAYHQKFLKFLRQRTDRLCEDCLRRIEKNPLRAFDCKVAECAQALADAPEIGGHLCGECNEHFDGVKHYLKLLGMPFRVNHRIVRGLDYYVRTAFEFTAVRLGAQNAISAGGRYDGLVKAMGGADLAGVGFSIGVERAVILLEALKSAGDKAVEKVFFALIGRSAIDKMIPMINMLRKDGVNCEWDYEMRSLKGQMRLANKLKAHTVVIIGDDELQRGEVVVKNMHTGVQAAVRIEDLTRHFVHMEV